MSNVFMVCGLGFGDEGKGTTVDYLARKYGAKLVVRYNGGAQAGHNVVTPDGRHHEFAQFGSGTFIPGVRTHCSRFALFDPVALWNEAHHLASVGVPDALFRYSVDPRALMTTEYHRLVNRFRERARSAMTTPSGDARHGSCGMGIGETMRFAEAYPAEAPRAGDFGDEHALLRKLDDLCDWARAEIGPAFLPRPETILGRMLVTMRSVALEELAPRALRQDVIFEGAQGVLLDQHYGFPPHQTYSTCTLENSLALVDEETAATCRRIGVLRSYMTRHGAGPLPTEVAHVPDDEHNRLNDYQGEFRRGYFDAQLMRYAVAASGATELALTHVDLKLDRWCTRYDAFALRYQKKTDRLVQTAIGQQLRAAKPVYEESPVDVIDAVEQTLELPVRIVSSGKAAGSKVER